MANHELNAVWDYLLTLEKDLENTSRYVEPRGQENIFSFEFAKLLILSCVEIESVIKKICEYTDGIIPGNIGEYKRYILKNFPKIIEAKVYVPRLGEWLVPFDSWDEDDLNWWNAYTDVKHNMSLKLCEANYMNACMALSGLYILILYLSHIYKQNIEIYKSIYIKSTYSDEFLSVGAEEKLPDFA